MMTAVLRGAQPSPRMWPALALLPIIVSGSVKASGMTAIGGVDLTLLSLVAVVLTAALALVRRPEYPFLEMLPYFLFVVAVLVGIARSVPGEYSALKARDFLFITTPVVVLMPAILRGRSDLHGMAMTWFASGTFVSILALVLPADPSRYGRAGIGGATLGPAYLAAAAIVVGVAMLGEGLIRSALAVPGVLIAGVALVLIASRGPILAAAAGLACWLLLGGRLTSRSVSGVLILLVAVMIGIRSASEGVLDRLVFEDSARAYLWSTAWDAFLNHPLMGLGWAGFSEFTTSGLNYPHNIVLETLSELGLTGLLILLALGAATLVSAFRARKHPEARVLTAVAAVGLVGQMFSADLSNRTFWIAVVPCLLLASVLTENDQPRAIGMRTGSGIEPAQFRGQQVQG